jgi:hypothetical protein
MTLDLFDRRTMTGMVLERKAPRTFVRDLFFGNRQPYDTEHIDFDVETHVRRLAPFSNPRLAGQVMDPTGFTARTYTPPLVQPKMATGAERLLVRLPGDTIYDTMSPEERAAALLGKDLGQLDDAIARREEWMCVRALFDGQIQVVGDGVNDLIDFGRNASLSLGLIAAAQRWNAATADIPKNFRDWRQLISRISGIGPDTCIMGSDAVDALLSNTTLAAMLDTARIDLGQISPELSTIPGVVYIGRFKGTGIDLWGYHEWYVDPATGVETAIVSPKTIMLGSTSAVTELAYGAVPIASGTDSASRITLAMGTRIPDSWVSKEPPVRYVKLSARPLPIPKQVNGFLTAQVVA